MSNMLPTREAEVLTLKEVNRELLVYLKWAMQFCPHDQDCLDALALIEKHQPVPIKPKPIRLVTNHGVTA